MRKKHAHTSLRAATLPSRSVAVMCEPKSRYACFVDEEVRTMSRPTSYFVTLFVAALLAGTSLHVQAQDKVRFQLDWAPIGSHAAAHLAQVKGYFKDAGL